VSSIPEEERRFTAVYKIVTLGEPAVGKTSLVTKYVTGRFQRDYRRTLGIDISTYDTKVENNLFKLLIWDLAGQEIFVELRTRYCQGAGGGIVAFDLTRPQTLEAVPDWVKSVREAVEVDPVLILLGNKADLVKKRKVSEQEASKLAKDLGLHSYIETSAKTGQHVTECFNSLALKIHKQGLERLKR
jgi:small GTP-binding protein